MLRQTVDRDREEVVPLRRLGEVLEHPDCTIRAPHLLHQIRHQEVRIDAFRVGGETAAVGADRLVAHAGESEHPGLELRRRVVAAGEVLELHQRVARLIRLAPLELAHRELAVVVRTAVGVDLDELGHRLLVVVVVVAREVDARLLGQPFELRAA